MSDPKALRQLFEVRALLTLADDQEIEFGQLAHRLNHPVMSFALNEMPDRKECWAGQTEGATCFLPIQWVELFQINTIAQDNDLLRSRTEIDQGMFKGSTDGDQTRCLANRPLYEAAWYSIAWDQVDIGTARGRDNRQAKPFSDPRRGDAVRIHIMSINRIKTDLRVQAPN